MDLPTEVLHKVVQKLDAMSSYKVYLSSKALNRRMLDPERLKLELIKQNLKKYMKFLESTLQANEMATLFKALKGESITCELYEWLLKLDRNYWEASFLKAIETNDTTIACDSVKDIYVKAVEKGDYKVVELLQKDARIDPSALNNWVIRYASGVGHCKVVEVLLRDARVDPSCGNNEAIRKASMYGHSNVVELLLQDDRVDPSAKNNEAVRKASEFGHFKVVELLLERAKFDSRINPSDDDNYAIRCASNYKVVELLLQDSRVDPSAMNNEAIRKDEIVNRSERVRKQGSLSRRSNWLSSIIRMTL